MTDLFRNPSAAGRAIAERQPGLTKPTLKRNSWTRLHTDLLDDNRWPLIAHRAGVSLNLVEALIVRLEVHACNSEPRGFVGDFSFEGMAVRYGVEMSTMLRVVDELERPDIGWIDQGHLVTFWSRNPDRPDDTATERKRRQRARQKAARLLAGWARTGLISEAERTEREQAMRQDGCDVDALIASWRSVTKSVTVTRDIVTVTPRAEQIINQDAPASAAPVAQLGNNFTPIDPSSFADRAAALQWLKGDGEALLASRMGVLRSTVVKGIARWEKTVCHDVTALARIVHGSLGTNARGDAFRALIETQVARQAAEIIAPALPLPPMALKRRGDG